MESSSLGRDTAWAMSEENLEIVRRWALSEFRDTQRLPERGFAPDFVFDVSTFEGYSGQAEFTLDGFNERFASWIEPYDEWTFEVERLEDAGGSQVVAFLRQRGRVRSSDSWVEMHYAVLYTFAEGVIQRAQLYTPPERALEAAGLSE
jgi:ketosteroid isomerase-like protein